MSTCNTTKRIVVAFAAGLSLLIGAWVAAALQAVARENAIDRMNQTQEVLSQLDDFALQSQEAEALARRFLTDADSTSLRSARAVLLAAKQTADRVRILTADSPGQQSLLAMVRPLLDAEDAALASLETPAGLSAFRRLDRDDATGKIRGLLADMQTEERMVLVTGADSQKRNEAASYVLLFVASFCSLALILLSAKWVSREFRLRAAADGVLAAREEQYRQVVEMAGDMIMRVDAGGRFTFCNQTLLATMHFTADEILGYSWLKLVRLDRHRAAQRFYLRQAARQQKNTYYELPIIDGHGRERWVGQSVQLIVTDGKISGFQAIAREITERKRAEMELEQSRNFIARIASTTPGILYVYDLDESRLVYNNHESAGTLGNYRLEPGEAHHFAELTVHPEDRAAVRAHHAAIKQAPDGEVRRIEYRARHSDGQYIWLSVRETAFERAEDRSVRKVVGIAQDVTERIAAQEKLTWQANFDALTGLANRHNFRTRLEGALRRAGIDHSSLALCLFDIDEFKAINDQFGHPAGDEVLEEVGNIVRGELRANDFAARMGGDEFCFALPGADENEAARVAERIRNRLSTLTFGLPSGTPFSVTATFGVADSRDQLTARGLIEAADRALYRAKDAGRNRVCVHAA